MTQTLPKLWHCDNARSLRALWALEELEIPYDLEVMPFPPRFLHKPFMEINPLGTIPYLQDGDTFMAESSGICLYLVEKYQRHDFGLKPDHPEYAQYLNWLFHSDATLTFPQTVFIRFQIQEPQKGLGEAGEAYRKWYLARLKMLNAKLKNNEFLVDGRFTVADIAIHFALFLGELLGFSDAYEPQTLAYLQRLKERPGFQRAQRAQVKHAPKK